MSVSGKLVLAIKMLLESQQYKAELNQAVSDTQDAARKVEGSTKGMGDAVQQAVQGQSAAVRGAATALVSLNAVAAGAVLAAAAVGLAHHQAGQETLAFEKAIISTGNRAGVTSGQLADMARSIDGIAGTQATASAALATITASGQVARENLEKVALAAVEMERAGVQSLTETARVFKDLGESPVKAVLRLNESTNFLTASTYAQIKAAADLGDAERAASIAQNSAADMMRDRAAQVEKHLGTLERAWRSVRDLAKEAWDQMLNVGRPDTAADQLNKAGERVAFLQQQVDGRKTRGLASGDLDKQLEAAKALHATMRETARLDERAAGIKAENLSTERARIELAQELEKSASKQEKMAIAVAAANALADRAGASAAERKKLVAAAEEKYAEKQSKASKTAQTELDREAALLANLSGVNSDYMEQLTRLQAIRAKGNLTEAQYIEHVEALIAKQPMAKRLMDETAKATTAADKATAALNAERAKSIAQMAGEVEKIEASVRLQEEQNARLGLSKEAIAELDAAKLEMLATDLELQAIKQLDKNLDEVQYTLLLRQAEAYRDLARAKREGGAKQAGIESAKEAEKEAKKAGDEWERAGERIEQNLTDSLMRGFEAGKDGAQNLADTTENMFKTMVLRPTISAFMKPVAAFAQSIFDGGAGGAGGSGGLGGIMNIASMGNTAMSLYSSMQTGLAGMIGNGVGSIFGTTAGNAALAQALGYGSASAQAAAAGASIAGGGTGAGAGMGAGMAGAGAFAAVAALVLNALGAFKSERKNGGGLMGTLGGGQLSAWEEWREGGTLFSGPSFNTFNPTAELDAAREKLAKAREAGDLRNVALQEMLVTNLEEQYSGLAEATAAQSKIIQTAYDAMRTSAGDMADVLGLSSDKVREFTTLLGGEKGIALDGLKPEEAQAKIAEALATANNELAQQILGTWETTTRDVTRVVTENMGSAGEDASLVFSEITNTITGTRYVASEYAKEGEKAIDTLLRLSTSMTLVNETADALGYEMGQASLAAAAAASNIVEAFGGVEAFTQSMSSYFQNFFSEEEQRAATARQVARALGEVGFEVDPAVLEGATRPAIRAFVDSVAEQFGFASEEYVAAVKQANVLSGIIEALPPATAATQANTAAVDDATRAAEEAAKKWQDITDALLGDRDSLAIELLRAQGQEEAALAAERALGITGMDAYQVALFDSNAALRLQITSLERMRDISLQLAAELPDVLDKFRTPEQRTTARYDSIAADLQKAGIATDTANLAGLLANATKDQIALAAIEVAGFAGTTDEMRLALVRAASGLADLKDSAQQTAQASVDSAYQTLQRLVEGQRKTVEASRTASLESIASLKGLTTLLHASVRNLLGEVDGTADMLASAGSAFISQTLASVRGGGALPDRDALAEAIDAVRGGLNAGNFASQFDLDLARLETAADLAEIERIGGKQLTEAQQAQRVAENQLKALDAILNNAQAEMDVFKGIRDGVVTSIPEALALLARSMGGGQAAAITAPGSGVAYTAAQVGLADGFARDRIAAGDIAGLYRGYTENGISSADAAYHLQRLGHNVTQADVLAAVKAAGLPAFEAGGWHAGGWAMVGEKGPELAYMPPAQIYNARDTNRMLGSGGADMAEMSRAFSAIAGLDTTLRVVSGVQVRLLSDMKTLFAAWHRDGLPPERVETPVTEEEGETA